jgi:predicted DNA binding CopG/RHH family protein
MTDTKKQSQVPDFKSRQEMAEFWDTHDVSDYWEELEPVKLRVAKNLTDTLNVRFTPEDMEKLQKEAEAKGIGPSTLARMWIKERLAAHQTSS